MKKILKLLTSSLMTVALLVSCGSKTAEAPKEAATPKKVAIVFSTGGLGDKSFNDSAYRGLEMAKEKLGIEFDYYEPKDASAEAQSQLFNYAEKGDYDLIIATGFSMADSVIAAAKEFPDQKFAGIDIEVDGIDNFQAILFSENEGSFLVGALAAMMTKTNTIGFVGGMDIPVIQRFQSGYNQGAKAINPDIEIIETFVNGSNPFNDPVSSKALTSTMIKQGVDVVYHAAGASGSGVFQAAKEAGIYAVGVDSNQDDIVKGTILTSMLKNVDNAVFAAISEVLDGKFKPGFRVYGIADNGVGLTNFEFTKDIIGQEKIDKLNDLATQIKEGKIEVKKYLK